MKRTLAFLSGAPRTSTKTIASLTGGRQHILGTINGFEVNGWDVDTYIVGDKVPENWLMPQHEMNKGKSFFTRLGADALRIGLQAKHIRQALKDLPNPDWVYERFAAFQLFGYFFQRRGLPWILETNEALFNQASSDLKHVALPALARWAERFAYEKCDILVVVSEELKGMLVDSLGVSPNKVVVVPNAADIDTFDPGAVNAQRLFDEDTFVIGFQGGMYKWAGLDYLVRAISVLRNRGLNVAAVLLGDGHERKALEDLSRSLGIDDYVKFPGRVNRETVPQFIAGYDIGYSGQVRFSAGSMYHSPLKLYDYMSMGKPVLASEFADAVSLTRNGELGYLYEPENLEALVESATRAYNDRERIARMSTSIRFEIVAKHSWQKRMEELIATVDAFLSKGRLAGTAHV